MMIPFVATMAATLASPLAVPTGQELLDQMSYRAFQFFYQQSHATTGFSKDRAANFGTSDTFTVSSVASTGYALTAYAIAVKRNWLDRNTALGLARKTFRALVTTAPKNKGWFYHFIDWQTGARQWQCEVSSIDSALLFCGMIVAQQYFQDGQLTADFNTIMNAVDWKWMLTDGGTKPNSTTLCMGWKPESGFINARWGDYSEQKMLIVTALGASKDMPDTLWTAFSRPVVKYKNYTTYGGGPIFIHQMAEGYLDLRNKRDAKGYDYWNASKGEFLAQRQYAADNSTKFKNYGINYWGFNASDGPDGYQVSGFPGWGGDNGTISPTGVAASAEWIPTEAMACLDNIAALHPDAWGRYGFSNGINAQRNWKGPDQLGIDAGMAMVAIENRRDNFVRSQFMAHPIIKKGMSRITWIDTRKKSNAPKK